LTFRCAPRRQRRIIRVLIRMSERRRSAAALSLLGLTTIGVAAAEARAAGPSSQELLSKIDALQAQIDELKAEQQRQAERERVEATKAAVRVDAEQRSKLVDGDITATYHDGKLVFETADKTFSLHPWFQLQVRSVTNIREYAGSNGGDQRDNGFEIRRMKFAADGHAFTPDLTYLFQWNTDRKDGGLKLEEAWARYRLPGTPFLVKGGQLKDPLSHEQVVSS
jgi:hypothetical protein